MAFFDLPSEPTKKTKRKKKAPAKKAKKKAPAKKAKKKPVRVAAKATTKKAEKRKPRSSKRRRVPRGAAPAKAELTKKKRGSRKQSWREGQFVVGGKKIKVNVLQPNGWLGIGECKPPDLGRSVLCLFHMPSGGRLFAIEAGNGQKELMQKVAAESEGLTNWGSPRAVRAAQEAISSGVPPLWFGMLGEEIFLIYDRMTR